MVDIISWITDIISCCSFSRDVSSSLERAPEGRICLVSEQESREGLRLTGVELSSVGPRVVCGVGSQGGCVVGIDGSKHPLECRECWAHVGTQVG